MTNNTLPLISIALCTYNGEKYIKEQLDSIVLQSYKKLEIIITDDNSSDRTLEFIKSYNDNRIKIIKNNKNIGYNLNFQKCLNLCSGEYICISDQDDIWNRNKVFDLYGKIKNSVMVYSDSELIGEDNQSLGSNMSDLLNVKFTHIKSPLELVFRNIISGHSMMFNRRLLSVALPVPNGIYYDWWLAFAAAASDRIEYSESTLVKHRKHSQSATKLALETQECKPEAVELIANIKIFLSQNELSLDNKDFLTKLLSLEIRRFRMLFSPDLFFLLWDNFDHLFLAYRGKSKISKINICRKNARKLN